MNFTLSKEITHYHANLRRNHDKIEEKETCVLITWYMLFTYVIVWVACDYKGVANSVAAIKVIISESHGEASLV